jgi:serine/threonine protein kinase
MTLVVQHTPGLGVRFTPPMGPGKEYQSPLQLRYPKHDLVLPISSDIFFTRFFSEGINNPRTGSGSLISIDGEDYQLCGKRISSNSKTGTSIFIAEEMKTGKPVIVKKLAIGELKIVSSDESTPLADVFPADESTPPCSPLLSGDPRLGTPPDFVVLSSFDPELGHPGQTLESYFFREGMVRFSPHQNILTAKQFQAMDNTMIIIMDLLHGISFRDLLNLIKSDALNPRITIAKSDFTPKEITLVELNPDQKTLVKKELELIALDSLLQMVDAIKHLEQHNIVHCDIKPPNINFDIDYVPKLLDFGNYLEANCKYGFQSPLGTREYISPERIPDKIGSVSKLSFDSRTDLFSLTIILYELFAGQTPFFRKQGNDKSDQVQAIYEATKKLDYEKLTKDCVDLELLEFIHSQLVRLEERLEPVEYEAKLRTIAERMINASSN